MDSERQASLRGHLGRGALFSALLHASVLLPFGVLAFIFGEQEAAQRAEEVDVSFQPASATDLPADLPKLEDLLDPAPSELAAQDKEKDKKKQKDKTAPELAAKPDPEVAIPETPKIPEAPRPPEPPPPPKAHEKVVDLDNDKAVEPPPDAKYLAQKNNRADKETRATDTNLDRAQKGTQGSSPSDRRDDRVGDDKDKIAQLEDQKSKLGRAAPAVTPHENPDLEKVKGSKKSLLTLRDAPRIQHEITPETVDSSLPRDPEGLRTLPMEGLQSLRDVGGRAGQADKVRLRVTGQEYEYLFGAETDAQRRLAQTERSKHGGHFTSRLGRVQSALENFIPEVQPGNQTELNTRAAPFAAYIARMHRSIHQLWGFGVLEDWDSKGTSNPLNNPALITKLELVLNGDGTVDKVTMVRSSGYLPFDETAIDVAFSAGPYPDPPRAIRSANGKIYVHWTFHRDDRQCATSGVDYFILDNGPPGADKGGHAANPLTESRPSINALKRLQRGAPTDTAGHRAKMRELDAAAGGEPEPDPVAARRAAQQVVHADDPAARAVADQWFDAYARGDIQRMLKQASFPFRSSSGIAAKSRAELQGLLAGLLEESSGKRTVRMLTLYSSAGIRGVAGGLPAGFDDGAGMLFAVGHAGGETFVLVLQAKDGAWHVVGLVRR